MKSPKNNQPPFRSLSVIFMELEAKLASTKPIPKISDIFATLYVAISCIIMAYGSLFGFLSILVFYAIWLPKIYYKKTLILRLSKETFISLILPSFAVISTLWSDYPTTTIYYALEFASLIICAIIISKLVSINAFIRGVIIGSALVLIASLISGRYMVDSLSGSYSLIGLFGSKNMVGLFAEIGILFSFFGVLTAPKNLLLSILMLPLFIISLYLSKSATSELSIVVTFAIILLVYFVTRLPQKIRVLTFACISFLIVSGMAAAISIDLHKKLFQSIGKDSTMSGRTILWDNGIYIGLENPLVGHGYSAFWVRGNQRAEVLWHYFNIADRIGFHFHNLYIESFVELGAVGFAMIIALLIIVIGRSIYMALRHGMDIEFVLPLGISFMFLIRSFAEVDVIGTFSIGPLLFFSIIPRLAAQLRKDA